MMKSITLAVAILSVFVVNAEEATPTNVRIVERVVTNIVEKIVEKPVEVIVEKLVTAPTARPQPVERIVEKKVFVDRPVEKIVTNVIEKVRVVERVVTNVVEKTVDRPVEKLVVKPIEKIVEKPVEKIVDRYVTNTVEKIVEKKVHDFSEEERLRREKTAADRKSDTLEASNTFLANDNERLKEELEAARERCRRLERIVPKGQVPKLGTGRQANITSKSTYYDRKEGFAVFDGRVHVDDERYQLHADKAYVFMDGTNSLKRLVALGNVAMTNETKRAYGVKASYYRESGMVILYGDANRPAEVRDEAKYDDQSVVGEKIKFWIDREQVEVIKSRLTAPVSEGAVPFAPKL